MHDLHSAVTALERGDRLVYRDTRLGGLLILLVAAPLLALGVYGLAGGAWIRGGLFALAGAYCLFLAVRRLVRPKERLVIDDEGITQLGHTARWEEIEGTVPMELEQQRFTRILLTEEGTRRLRGEAGRAASLAMTGTGRRGAWTLTNQTPLHPAVQADLVATELERRRGRHLPR